jgi:DnaJ family protein C protein 7
MYDEALSDTDASLVLFPTSFKALRTRARINLHLEKFDSAIADFKSAIQQAGVEGNDGDVRALKSELKKAEAALKRSKTKDYYKILGVPRDCSELEIKKGYRRESLKHHPDKVRASIAPILVVTRRST